jgi:hypothetical protein
LPEPEWFIRVFLKRIQKTSRFFPGIEKTAGEKVLKSIDDTPQYRSFAHVLAIGSYRSAKSAQDQGSR